MGRVWKRLPEDVRARAAEALWAEDALEPQAEAVSLLVRQMKFRPQTVWSLSREKKIKYLAGMPGVPDTLAAHLLVAYHLATQRPMMAAFLDALGIAHEDGLITTELPGPPAADKLEAAAKHLTEAYPPAAVRLYFLTLLGQDPATWGGLEELIDRPPIGAEHAST